MSTVRPDESILTDRLDLRPVAVEDADELAAAGRSRVLHHHPGGRTRTGARRIARVSSASPAR